MAELTMSFGGGKIGSLVIDRMAKGFDKRLNLGLRESGGLLATAIKNNLRKYVQSDNPSREFPSLRTGRLFGSVFAKVIGQTLRVGPNTVYAAVHEFGGGRNIPPRPYVAPAWEKNKNKVMKMIGTAIRTGHV